TRAAMNGLRLSVMDNVHVEGAKTSLSCQAYINFYVPQTETAAYTKKLINIGAVIIGKTKMNAFAGSEKPPNQGIDYFPPWNPRADGYLCPAGSSSGYGVTVAGYEWCDVTIGTDSECFGS
ncbi:amidase signature domain-containing protein, partial [Lasiosphaeris hirsuta]